MTTGLILRAYGRLVEVTGDGSALEMVRERLPKTYRRGRGTPQRSWSVTDQGDGNWTAAVDGDVLRIRPAVTEAVEAMLSDLELWIAEHAQQLVFVHAGCVALGGQALVLPGPTYSGKSTLVAALCRAGCAYLSDEFAVVDRRGLVHPYPRPLSLRSATHQTERREPADFGALSGTQPVRVCVVASLRFDASVGWAVEPRTQAHTTLDLLANTVPARSRPGESLAAVERACKHARAIKGTRDDADAAAARLLGMLP